jgi:hypothetical protein
MTDDKISKLIPRLGSAFDGEVVATARAIGRTLQASGRDWHDLAKAAEAISLPAPAVEANRQGIWENLSLEQREALLGKLHGEAWLSAWEEQFVESLRGRSGRTSPKQAAVMERLINRSWARWRS